MPFAGFTDVELKVIQLRTSGVTVREIAQELNIGVPTVHNYLSHVYAKIGFSDLCLFGIWAHENGLDAPLGPETSAERPYPGLPKVRGNLPIRLGRIARAMPGYPKVISSVGGHKPLQKGNG